jgi:hypothetical protein
MLATDGPSRQWSTCRAMPSSNLDMVGFGNLISLEHKLLPVLATSSFRPTVRTMHAHDLH